MARHLTLETFLLWSIPLRLALTSAMEQINSRPPIAGHPMTSFRLDESPLDGGIELLIGVRCGFAPLQATVAVQLRFLAGLFGCWRLVVLWSNVERNLFGRMCPSVIFDG